MNPNTVVHAATLALDHEPVPADQTVDGEPTTGVTPSASSAAWRSGCGR